MSAGAINQLAKLIDWVVADAAVAVLARKQGISIAAARRIYPYVISFETTVNGRNVQVDLQLSGTRVVRACATCG